MPADALAPKVARASAGMVLAVKDRTCIVVPDFISFTWVKPIQDMIQNVNISFATQFNMLRVNHEPIVWFDKCPNEIVIICD